MIEDKTLNEETNGQGGDETVPIDNSDLRENPATQDKVVEEETFLDVTKLNPNDFPPEIKAIYREMQRQFTKDREFVKGRKQDIALVDAFRRDPVGVMKNLARQYGHELVAPGEKTHQTSKSAQNDSDFVPNTWDEVRNWIKSSLVGEVEQMLEQRLAPLAQNLGNVSSRHLEDQLERIDPNWRIYEDEVIANLQEFPKLKDHPQKLIAMSRGSQVPTRGNDPVRARNQISASRVSGSGIPKVASPPKEIKTFQDAVDFAMEKLKR